MLALCLLLLSASFCTIKTQTAHTFDLEKTKQKRKMKSDWKYYTIRTDKAKCDLVISTQLRTPVSGPCWAFWVFNQQSGIKHLQLMLKTHWPLYASKATRRSSVSSFYLLTVLCPLSHFLTPLWRAVGFMAGESLTSSQSKIYKHVTHREAY